MTGSSGEEGGALTVPNTDLATMQSHETYVYHAKTHPWEELMSCPLSFPSSN